MDKAAIFAEVTQRNALLRASGLPPLDVPAEYAHQVAVAERRDYQAICEGHAEEREAIRQQVLTEYLAKYGAEFGNTTGGRWAIGVLSARRFAAHMATVRGVPPPDAGPSRGHVICGDASKDAS